MRPDSTPEQRRRLALGVLAAVIVIGGSRWSWLAASNTPRWRGPSTCVERYRFEATTMVGERQTATTWELTIAEVDGRPQARMIVVSGDPVTEDPKLDAASEHSRELWVGETGVGPAAPDLACRVEILDPIEDVLAFAWPALPPVETAVGESWTGRAVEGRCHAWACADDQARLSAATPGCRASPWRERLVSAGPSLALVRSSWSVGSDPASAGAAILTSRAVLIADGRPVRAFGAIDSRIGDARLALELERLDDCPPPPEPSALARLRARLRAYAGKKRRPRT